MNKQKLSRIPPKPGVYLFKDKSGKILYIGKAANLKSRVNSYFQKSASLESAKEIMVTKVEDLEYIVVDSEIEALLLETNLIKKHKPSYNVDLKDDKYFIYLKITLAEDFPRVLKVRRIAKDKNRYFGPYTSAVAVKETLRLVKKIFPYKICNNPPEKPCLGYHIGRCLGHLTDTNTKKDYQQIIQGLIQFLEGKNKNLLADLKNQMKEAAKRRKYEKAARLRDQIRSIEILMERQKVVSSKLEDQDIISLVRDHKLAAINLFQIREGKLIHQKQFLLQNIKLFSNIELIESFLNQYYTHVSLFPKEIILPEKIDNTDVLKKFTKAKFSFPQKGKKHKLIELGEKNAQEFLRQRQLKEEDKNKRGELAIKELARKLGLKKNLQRIEAYDISNIQGTNAVGSMVVFTAGLPEKSQYRKFKINTVKSANDPAMMAEIIGRRFKKNKTREKGRWPLPDLIILDGGKGQLSVVKVVLRDFKISKPLIALAKREEEIFVPGKKDALPLPPDSLSLKLLKQIRDEAHRFAIDFYRRSHQKETKKSLLDDIPGIGPKTKKALISAFGSVKNIQDSSLSDLEKIVGKKLAKRIKEYI